MKVPATPHAAAYHRVLQRYTIDALSDYLSGLLATRLIDMRISKPRTSKLGDYRMGHKNRHPAISLNADLNTYAFAIVLLHEIAHHDSFTHHGRHIKPHGKEWQSAYRTLSGPLLVRSIFPPDLQRAFIKYLNQPSASSCTDHNLLRAMRAYDPVEGDASHAAAHLVTLDELPVQARFRWRDGRSFVKIKKIRTRIRCYEIHSKGIYLFHAMAQVQPET